LNHDDTYLQTRARSGGYARQAYAKDRKAAAQVLRDGRDRKRREKILEKCPWLADDPAELERRVESLMKSEMAAMSLQAAKARRLAAEARRLAAEAAEVLGDDTEAAG
jgi:hypothetical protein